MNEAAICDILADILFGRSRASQLHDIGGRTASDDGLSHSAAFVECGRQWIQLAAKGVIFGNRRRAGSLPRVACSCVLWIANGKQGQIRVVARLAPAEQG